MQARRLRLPAGALAIALTLMLLSALPAAARVRLTPHSEAAAFLRWISARYPHHHGYWVCPQGQIFGNSGVCLAEMKVGRQFHSLHASPTIQHGHVVLLYEYDTAWTRQFSPFTKRVIAGFHTPGTASVNSPAYDWAWLAGGAHYDWSHGQRVFSVLDYDGDSSGFDYLFTFHCRTHGPTIVCRNPLGDAIRYRPHG